MAINIILIRDGVGENMFKAFSFVPGRSCDFFVATIDTDLAEYAHMYLAQRGKKETVETEHIVKPLFEHRARKNRGAPPEYIILVRDGVGETMFDTIIAEEIEPIRNAYTSVIPV